MFLIIAFTAIVLYSQKKQRESLLLMFFLLSDGFQVIPEPLFLFPFALYGKDYVLVYFLSILVLQNKLAIPRSRVTSAIVLFLFYVIVIAVIDIIFYNPSVSGWLLIIRHYLFLLSFFALSKFSIKAIESAFKIILGITVILSIVCLLQPIIGVKLLTMGNIGITNTLPFRWYRYTNLPYYLYFLFFVVLVSPLHYTKYKGGILILFFLVCLLTLTRTLIFGLIATIAIAMVFNIMKANKRFVFALILFFILLLPILGPRMISGVDDIQLVLNNDQVSQLNEGRIRGMTFQYRISHFVERLLYLNQDRKMLLTGMGFIHEKDFEPIFVFGIPIPEESRRIQLEQADIAWSNLIIRLGLIGTVLYMIIYGSLCHYFYMNKDLPIASAGLMYMIFSLILTFGSGLFAFCDFFIIPFIVFWCIKKANEKLLVKQIVK